MIWLTLAAGFLLGALAYRIRGGLFDLGHPWGRLIFAVPLSVVLVLPLFSMGWLTLCAMLVVTLIAVYWITILGHGTYMDLGRNPEGHLDEPERPIYYLVGNEKPLWNPRQRLYHNFCGLLIKGVALGVLTAVPLIALSTDFTYLAFMAASASMPLCYLAAWNIPSTVKNFEQGPPLGEALYGAVIGASASVLIL